MPECLKTKTQDSTLLQLVSFTIGEEEYCVDILCVQEIIRMMNVTKVPNAPPFVDGVINLRGRVIPIIDLRVRFDMPRIPRTKDTRIVVVDLVEKTMGFVVDAVSEVLRIPKNLTEPPPPAVMQNVKSDFITSVAKLEDRLLILIDLEKMVSEKMKRGA